MSWAVGYDERWKRWVGYGVPAYCDHPKCDKEIDRGLGYVCGYEEPYGRDRGCGLYFCCEHGGGWLCPRCRTSKPPYRRIKPDHHEWVRHMLSDESWQEWRDKNPRQVKQMNASLLVSDKLKEVGRG